MTLNVPTDFTDIQAALDYLNDKKIAPNVTVNIPEANISNNTVDYSTSKLWSMPN
jgi:hypothetical protein